MQTFGGASTSEEEEEGGSGGGGYGYGGGDSLTYVRDEYGDEGSK